MSNELFYQGGIVAGSGQVGLTFQRIEENAKRRFDEWRAKRSKVLDDPKSSINDVRNEELREWTSKKGLKAVALLAELKRTADLYEEFQAEVEDLRGKHPDSIEPSLMKKRDEAFKALNRKWACKDLFGAPRANDTNFYAMPIPGEPTWEKDNGEMITGEPRDPRSFFAEGWKPLRVVPDFSGRITVLRRLLDDHYRDGDVPPSITAEKRKLVDLRLKLMRHREASKDLLRDASVDQSLQPQIDEYRKIHREIEQAISKQERVVVELGVDPRSV